MWPGGKKRLSIPALDDKDNLKQVILKKEVPEPQKMPGSSWTSVSHYEETGHHAMVHIGNIFSSRAIRAKLQHISTVLFKFSFTTCDPIFNHNFHTTSLHTITMH
ncbi:hypothetical protein TNCV_5060691 [Trichonephila clavipes]|nr:hypothetical protein TNCV_5060691 [Trichonephila clavipes]